MPSLSHDLRQGEPPLTTLAARSMVDVAIQRFLGYGFWRLSTSISTSFISQSSIIQDSIIIIPDISIINIKTAEPTTSSREVPTMNSNGTSRPNPFPGLNQTEAKTSLAEDDDIIFIGAKLLSSAPAPGRCSCGGLCNHYVATIRAPAPAPAPTPAPTPATIHIPAPARLYNKTKAMRIFLLCPREKTRSGREPKLVPPANVSSGPVMDDDGCQTFPTRKGKKEPELNPDLPQSLSKMIQMKKRYPRPT
ncbi:hypothetical protein CEP51_015943 [Fusarium floridanum]|uniref:Uncharacterized protein n=1 Tax=Fusarium floridanum TaxID=1325733 RepID=A0A428P073_9HYPO|nr:hypothetical protein CEP51_015943 [Fusarium floridanum]